MKNGQDGLHQYTQRKLDALRRHCDDVGRPFESIERTAVIYVNPGSGGMSPQEIIDTCGMLASERFHHVIFNVCNADEIAPLEIIGKDVIPQIAKIGPAFER